MVILVNCQGSEKTVVNDLQFVLVGSILPRSDI
jgi:hypothetical protein